MNELFDGSVTAAVAGKRWRILAIGLPSVNSALAYTPTGAGGPMRREHTR